MIPPSASISEPVSFADSHRRIAGICPIDPVERQERSVGAQTRSGGRTLHSRMPAPITITSKTSSKIISESPPAFRATYRYKTSRRSVPACLSRRSPVNSPIILMRYADQSKRSLRSHHPKSPRTSNRIMRAPEDRDAGGGDHQTFAGAVAVSEGLRIALADQRDLSVAAETDTVGVGEPLSGRIRANSLKKLAGHLVQCDHISLLAPVRAPPRLLRSSVGAVNHNDQQISISATPASDQLRSIDLFRVTRIPPCRRV